MEQEELLKCIESLLFITDQPLKLDRISKVTEITDDEQLKAAIARLREIYSETGRSMQIIEIGGGYQMSTKPEYGRWVRKLYHDKMTARLSVASLETLAIVAYRQPITRAEIEMIRGVEVIASLETLVERGLLKVVGRKETVGRPLLYGTSPEFLRLFGLNSLEDLPKLESMVENPKQLWPEGAPQDSEQGLLFPPQEHTKSQVEEPGNPAPPDVASAPVAADSASVPGPVPQENAVSVAESEGEVKPEDTAPAENNEISPVPAEEKPMAEPEVAPAQEEIVTEDPPEDEEPGQNAESPKTEQ